MPASDSSIAAKAPPSHGRRQIKPRYASRSSISAAAFDVESTVMIPNAPNGHHRIGDQIISYGLDPQRAAREKSDQQIAQMRDRRIGQDPLDIILQQGEQVADQDRGDGHDLDHHRHRTETVGVGRNKIAEQKGEHRAFGDDGDKGRHRSRRALIDVRRPHVERHDRQFEANTREDERETGEPVKVGWSRH